jgi:hypothetical protein
MGFFVDLMDSSLLAPPFFLKYAHACYQVWLPLVPTYLARQCQVVPLTLIRPGMSTDEIGI